MVNVLAFLFIGLINVAFCAASYFLVAALTYIASIAFGFGWSWMLALGVFAVCLLVRWVLKAACGDE